MLKNQQEEGRGAQAHGMSNDDNSISYKPTFERMVRGESKSGKGKRKVVVAVEEAVRCSCARQTRWFVKVINACNDI